MDTKQAVLDILNELAGEDLSDQMDENIFENGLVRFHGNCSNVT